MEDGEDRVTRQARNLINNFPLSAQITTNRRAAEGSLQRVRPSRSKNDPGRTETGRGRGERDRQLGELEREREREMDGEGAGQTGAIRREQVPDRSSSLASKFEILNET